MLYLLNYVDESQGSCKVIYDNLINVNKPLLIVPIFSKRHNGTMRKVVGRLNSSGNYHVRM